MVSKAKENRHMMFTEAAQLAKEAEVSELWLTHYSPSLIRPDDFMEPVRRFFQLQNRERTEVGLFDV